jgi:hypothetical protein
MIAAHPDHAASTAAATAPVTTRANLRPGCARARASVNRPRASRAGEVRQSGQREQPLTVTVCMCADVTGQRVRDMMKERQIIATLRTFTDRAMALEGRNVVTVVMGDFSRSIPGSNHQANLTATVIGKHVKLGTTGKVNRDVALPVGTPGIKGLWAYIAAAAQSPEAPFRANPHPLIRA